MSEMVSIAILRPTVIDGDDVFPGDKRKVPAATARRLIAMGKAEEVKRGRPRKNAKAVDDGAASAEAPCPTVLHDQAGQEDEEQSLLQEAE